MAERAEGLRRGLVLDLVHLAHARLQRRLLLLVLVHLAGVVERELDDGALVGRHEEAGVVVDGAEGVERVFVLGELDETVAAGHVVALDVELLLVEDDLGLKKRKQKAKTRTSDID